MVGLVARDQTPCKEKRRGVGPAFGQTATSSGRWYRDDEGATRGRRGGDEGPGGQSESSQPGQQ
jgi:hypothetical protein